MSAETTSLELHDRATRGETLTGEEKAKLDAWYATQDSEESSDLNLGEAQVSETVVNPATLRSQITALLAQITSITAQLQLLVEQNNVLRQENLALQQKLAKRVSVEAT